MKGISYHIVLLFFLLACVEPFDFKIPEEDRLLVVDALLTNENKRHTVSITFSSKLNTDLRQPLTGAQVRIQEIDGEQFNFTEDSAGVYLSEVPFSGTIGSSYILEITTQDGFTYSSTPQTMPAPAEIEEVYEELVEIIDPGSGENTKGFQFFLDVSTSNPTGYFRYNWIETYQIEVPFPSGYTYDTLTRTYDNRKESIGVCYTSDTLSSVLVTSAENGVVSEFPVRFIPLVDQQLRSEYSLLVEQYSITEDALGYYKTLRENNESGGSLFDQQQGAVIGNLTSNSDENELVLGYFEVSSVTRKRIFADGPALREKYNRVFSLAEFRYTCTDEQITIVGFNDIYEYILNNPSHRIFYIITPPSSAPAGIYMAPRTCTDCTWYADPKKPDYWIF